MFTHDMKNRVYIGPDISKQPTLTCVQTEIRLSLLGGTAEMSAVSFFVYEPVTWWAHPINQGENSLIL